VAVLIRLLLSKIAPFKDYLVLAALVGVIVASAWFIHHERQIGAQRWAAALAAKELEWQLKVNKVEADAKSKVDELQGKLDAKIAHPPANPLHVRVCNPAPPSPSPMRPDGGTVGGSDGSGGPGKPVEDQDQGVDIGPATEYILNRAGAKIEYLQNFIRICQQKGICKRETD
jgi:hypothetical protein